MGGGEGGAHGALSPALLSRLSIAFFACFGALLSAAAIGDGRPASASLALTFLGASWGGGGGGLVNGVKGAVPDALHLTSLALGPASLRACRRLMRALKLRAFRLNFPLCPLPVPAGCMGGQQRLMLWADATDAGGLRPPQAEALSEGADRKRLSAAQGALLHLLLGWAGTLTRVCGGPLYLAAAAASPYGFATLDGAAYHGKGAMLFFVSDTAQCARGIHSPARVGGGTLSSQLPPPPCPFCVAPARGLRGSTLLLISLVKGVECGALNSLLPPSPLPLLPARARRRRVSARLAHRPPQRAAADGDVAAVVGGAIAREGVTAEPLGTVPRL